MVRTVNKHIRIDAQVWERLEAAAKDCDTTANRLIAELATQWIKDREWPLTDVQIRVARASLFTAQAMARDMAVSGRESEIRTIRRYISTIVPDAPMHSSTPNGQDRKNGNPSQDNPGKF